MEADLEFVSRTCGILTDSQKAKILRDIIYVFMDHIAREIRFVFYDRVDRDVIYFENVYHPDGRTEKVHPLNLEKPISGDDAAFDVLIGFTHSFLSLESRYQDLLMGNTEHDWYT